MSELLVHGFVVGLVAFGLADMLALRAGPLGLFRWLRGQMGRASMPTWVKEGAECVFCWGFWAAAAGALVLMWVGHVRTLSELVLIWLAGAGVNAFLNKYVGY